MINDLKIQIVFDSFIYILYLYVYIHYNDIYTVITIYIIMTYIYKKRVERTETEKLCGRK